MYIDEIIGRKFHTGKIASGRNYPTDRVLRYITQGSVGFSSVWNPQNHIMEIRTSFRQLHRKTINYLARCNSKVRWCNFNFHSTSFHTQRKSCRTFRNVNENFVSLKKPGNSDIQLFFNLGSWKEYFPKLLETWSMCQKNTPFRAVYCLMIGR